MSITSQVLNFIKECSLKKLIVFLLLAGDISFNWWYFTESPPLKERCSSNYPEFSRILDHPVTLPDGGVMSEDGEVFPEGGWWSEDSIIRGCPCSGKKTCMSKCCPFGQALEGSNCVDIKRKDVKEFYTMNHFSIFPRKCDGNVSYSYPDVSIMDDGTLKLEGSEQRAPQATWCFDSSNTPGEDELAFLLCSSPGELQWKELQRQIKFFVTQLITVMSLVVNLFTLGVFTLLPNLRKGYGASIMCYVAVQCLRGFLAIVYIWVHKTTDSSDGQSAYCMCIGAARLFISLSTTKWQIAIAHQIWSVFSPGTGIANAAHRSANRKRFLVYSVLAWGFPVLVVVLMVTMELLPGAPWFLKVQFEPYNCKYNNTAARWLYQIGPRVLGEVVTMGLCAATLRRLAAYRETSEALHNSQSRRHNAKHIQWSELYIKVCLLLGMSYFLVTVLQMTMWIIPVPKFVNSTTQDIFITQGVEVFFILVCKKEVLSSLLQRIKSFKKLSNKNH